MGLHKRVSDEAWTIDERIEVIEAFVERAEEVMDGPLYNEENFSDPNSGVDGFKLFFQLNKDTGEQSVSVGFLRLEKAEYDNYIQQLRPFILSEQDIFLPKVTRHLEILLKDEYKDYGAKLSSWIDGFVTFEEPYFAPVHSYVYISDADGSNEIGASSAELALNYIYGRAVKSDIEKRRFIKQFETDEMKSISMALNEYLQQLMKLVYVVQHEILAWNKHGFFERELPITAKR